MFGPGLDPATFLLRLAIALPGLLLAIAFHEFSHAWVAVRRGDDTPAHDGRLTMNPLAHIDPIGALMLVLAGFGWAKPVQVRGGNLKHPLRDMALVAAAGPVANILLAVASAVVWRVMEQTGSTSGPVLGPLFAMVQVCFSMNVGLAVFNLIPIPPLDGSRVLVWLLPARAAESVARFEPVAPLIMLVLLFSGVLSPLIRPARDAVAVTILRGVGL
jgi:Zn-dependent protease